jgi:hypothetical protein
MDSESIKRVSGRKFKVKAQNIVIQITGSAVIYGSFRIPHSDFQIQLPYTLNLIAYTLTLGLTPCALSLAFTPCALSLEPIFYAKPSP